MTTEQTSTDQMTDEHEPATVPRYIEWARSSFDRVRGFVQQQPLSIALTLVLLITALATGTITGKPSFETSVSWASGVTTTIQGGSWWTVLSSLFIPWDPFQLIATMLGALVLLGIAERLMGTWRTGIAFLVTGVIGTTVGVLLQWVGSLAGEWWASSTAQDLTLDPLTGIVGALLTASAFAGLLWRRRIRVVTVAFILVFVIYDGDSSNIYRLLAALAGLLLGALMTHDRALLHRRRSSHRETRTLIATIVAITAIGPVIALVNPAPSTPFSVIASIFDSGIPDYNLVVQACEGIVSPACERGLILASAQGPGPFLLALLPLALLLLAAWGLRNGRRFAFWLAIAVNAALAVLSYFTFDVTTILNQTENADWTGWDVGELIVWVSAAVALPLIVLVILVVNRRHFTIASPRRAYRRFIPIVLSTLFVCAMSYYIEGLATIKEYVPHASPIDLLVDTAKRFIPVNFIADVDPIIVPSHDTTFVLYQIVGPAFWAVFIVAAAYLMTATETRAHASDEARLRQLLKQGKGGTLSYMTTWPGNLYWFSDDGKAAVAYRVINGIAITMSDPICTEERDARTITEFAEFCDRHSWVPVFYSVHQKYLPIFEEMGWQHMSVGEETIVRTTGLDFVGKSWTKVRQPLNRGIKDGLTTVWSTWDELPLATVAEITSISEEWVADKELPEMGFTLGGMEELKDPEVKIMLAIGPDGRIQAITSWMPIYGDGEVLGWTLDFMRRADGAINGVMEFLIASAALQMQEDGANVLSLSGAPLATKPLAKGEEPPPATVMTRLLDFLAKSLEPAYGFTSLFRFKAKFNPEYQTISMAYPDALALPAIGLAISKAYLPEVSPKEAVALVRTLSGAASR